MKKIGIRFKPLENGSKITKIETSKDFQEAIGLNNPKNSPHYYIERYLNDKNLYDHFSTRWSECFDKSLPKDFKNDCLYCQGKSTNEEDQKCSLLKLECETNYFLAANEFVNIVERNKHLISTTDALKRITLKFYECFSFYEGHVVFYLHKITLHCLQEGFLTLSQIFAKNSTLQNLKIINSSIDHLKMEKLELLMFNEHTTELIDHQLNFFENKKATFKEDLFIQNVERAVKHKNIKSKKTLSFKDIFNDNNYEKYIDVLSQLTPPIISPDRKFIGQPKKHKGVICSWFKNLRNKNIISLKYNRQQIVSVLNSEISDLDLGSDGKTFDNYSKEYQEIFESQLSENFPELFAIKKGKTG